MRERQRVIAIPEGWNIRTDSEMSNKKTPYGNTAHKNMEEKKKISQ